MNLLIIGLGRIGRSHLKSFCLSKKKYNIFLYDINGIESEIVNNKKFISKIKILKKFPTNLKFDLCIIATNSLERYSIINKLLKYNKTKYFMIEKYIFTKTTHYSFLRKKLFKISDNLFINLWGSVIADSFNIKLKSSNLKFFVNIKNGRFITNAIHFLDFFCYFTLRNLDSFKLDIKKTISSKREKYHEILGSITAENNKGFMKIVSKENIIYDNIKIIDGRNIYKIVIAINKKCILYKNSKVVNKINFPFAYKTTSKIFENYLLKKRKKKIYSNFKSNFKISEQIIKNISQKKKKIYIT